MVVASVSPRSPVRLPLDKHHAARRELLRPLAERLAVSPLVLLAIGDALHLGRAPHLHLSLVVLRGDVVAPAYR